MDVPYIDGPSYRWPRDLERICDGWSDDYRKMWRQVWRNADLGDGWQL